MTTIARTEAPVLRRSANLTRDAWNPEKRELTLAFASETPVSMWDEMEVLSCASGDVDLSRLNNKAALLLEHDRNKRIGAVLRAWVDEKDKVCRAICKVRKAHAAELNDDMDDDIPPKVSVSYERTAMLRSEKTDGATPTRTYQWLPYEVSLVSVPADDSVGIGRAKNTTVPETTRMTTTVQTPDLPAPEVPAAGATKTEAGHRQEKEHMDNEKKTDVASPPEVKAKQPDHSERNDVNEIRDIGDKYDFLKEAARTAAKNGDSLEKFRAFALDEIAKHQTPAIPQPLPTIGMSDKDKRRAWLGEAIQGDAGGMRELTDECRRRTKHPHRGQYTIPYDLFAPHRRDLTIAGTGSYVVGTDLLAGSFIDALRPNSIALKLGITVMPGLVGSVAIPKLATSVTSYWPTEGNAPTEGLPVLSQVTGEPNCCGAYVDISRKLRIQSAVNIEQIVRDDITRSIATAIDVAVFGGTGTEQPTGITQSSGAGVNTPAITAGTPTYAEVLGFPQSCMADNVDVTNAKWAMTSEVWAKLAATMRVATYGDIPLIDPAINKLIAWPYEVSESVPANTLIFGVWEHCWLGMWGAGLDINIDPYSLSTQGALRIVGLQDVDVMLRYPQAFAYDTSVTS